MRGWILLNSSTPFSSRSVTSFTLLAGLYRSVRASSSVTTALLRASIMPAVTMPLSCSIRLEKMRLRGRMMVWI